MSLLMLFFKQIQEVAKSVENFISRTVSGVPPKRFAVLKVGVFELLPVTSVVFQSRIFVLSEDLGY